jgi:hypothetical protein
MGRTIVGKVIRIAAGVIGVGVAGAACLAGGWVTGELLHAKLSHPEKATAQALASRFPDARNQPAPARQSALMAGLMQAKVQQVALFTPDAAAPNSAALVAAPVTDATLPAPQGTASKQSVASARRTRPNALLDDGQIASIKKRLNLTPSQERMWPAVEAELRKLSFAQPPQEKAAKGKAKPPATIDLSSTELERLKNAAAPLIMSFSADQKDELRTMARITGLEKFAP